MGCDAAPSYPARNFHDVASEQQRWQPKPRRNPLSCRKHHDFDPNQLRGTSDLIFLQLQAEGLLLGNFGRCTELAKAGPLLFSSPSRWSTPV